MSAIRLITGMLICQLVTSFLQAQSASTIKEYKKAFTTYPFSDPSPVPSFTKIYPYYRYDGFTDKPIQKEWTVVELENDFITVMILPEVGGKIWTAIEKSTGQPFIYYNHVVKFRDVAMRGPWTSGGLEANYGIIGHTPNCATPVDYTTKKNADGSVSCMIGVLDLLTRTNWQIEINLPKDKAYFTTASIWHNPTSLEQPYYHWMNTGIKSKGNLEFIYPGTHYIGHEGEYDDWPINKRNNKKISFYEQNDFGGYKSYHVFGKYTDFFGAYWHDDQFGMVRYAPQDEKAGKKIWIWGLSEQGMIWEKLLTDNDGQYVEVQSGRLFNQNSEGSTYTPFKHQSFSPYATDLWKEYWYPVLRTNGFVTANEYGALNLKNENGWVKIYFSPVQFIKGKIEIKEGEKIVYTNTIGLSPLKTFADSVKAVVDENKITVNVGENFSWESDPASGVLARPKEAPKDFDWNTAYGLYLQGKEFMDQKLFDQAEVKLKDALLKDHNYLPALVKMAELQLRNCQYQEAFDLAKKALSIDTHDGAANYFYGLASAQLGDTVNAKDGFTVATLSVPFRSAAYTELSKLYLQQKHYAQSFAYASKALDFNRYNISAYQLRAVCSRYMNDVANAEKVLDMIESMVPLDAFVKAERYFIKTSGQTITGLFQNELPHESYMELAITYISNGLLKEGEQILIASPQSPLNYYWLAWIQDKRGENYTPLLEKANQLSPLLVFPFRSEMVEVLEWASTKTDSWKPDYYLALILKDKNRLAESIKLLAQLKNTPDFAPFYAARAELLKDDSVQAEIDLKKAIQMENEEWRYHKLLASHYITHREFEKALSIAGSYYKNHPQNYILGMLYAKTLLLSKHYKESDVLLSKLNIIPFEGATEGRELYRETKLLQAIEQVKVKNYKKALDFINGSKVWPEKLGVGKPYEEDIDMRLEDWMSYLCYVQMKNRNEAEKSLEKIIQFTQQIGKKPLNFFAANHLVSAWAMKQKNQTKEAVDWLDQQIKKFPENKVLLWSGETFNNGQSALTDYNDPTTRIIVQLLELQKMKR
jgi:tetratricopeptide (TPR) repeat protein